MAVPILVQCQFLVHHIAMKFILLCEVVIKPGTKNDIYCYFLYKKIADQNFCH